MLFMIYRVFTVVMLCYPVLSVLRQRLYRVHPVFYVSIGRVLQLGDGILLGSTRSVKRSMDNNGFKETVESQIRLE